MPGRNPCWNGVRWLLLPLCLLGAAAGVQAAPVVHSAAVTSWSPAVRGFGRPVSDASLDQVRGGFDLGNGLMASFGLQEVTYINGVLAMSTQVTIPDIAKITQQQATALAATLSQLNFVQIGSGNSAGAGESSPLPAVAAPAATLAQGAVGTTTPSPMTAATGGSATTTATPVTAPPPSAAATGTAASAPQNAAATTATTPAAAPQPVAATNTAAPAVITGTPDAANASNTLATVTTASALVQGDGLAKLVQNTLNGQSIQTFTTLNVSLNTLQVLRQLNQQGVLQSAQLLSLTH